MPKEDNVLLDFAPHTHAKHEILRRYVSVWTPILTLGGLNGRVVYIDGFAGSGQYRDSDELGSPQLALDSVLECPAFNRIKAEVSMLFIELDTKRADHLRAILKARYTQIPKNVRYEVRNKEFNEELNKALDGLNKDNKRLAPTFCFVDPFGWSNLDYDTLARFMNEKKAELLITFMVGFLSRFTTEERLTSIKNLFTDTQLAEINNANGDAKHLLISKLFMDNLKAKIRASNPDKPLYDLSFRTIDQHNNTMYYLLYLTSSPKGIEVMKDAMYATSKGDKYLFSDYNFDPRQTRMMDYTDEPAWVREAGNEVYRCLAGKTFSKERVKEFIIMNTKWVFRAPILRYLEKEGKIRVSGKRNSNSYPDGCAIEFIA